MTRAPAGGRGGRSPGGRIILARVVTAVTLLALWELAGLRTGLGLWVSHPAAVLGRIGRLVVEEDLLRHAGVTLAEIALGLPLGVAAGALVGFVVGWRDALATTLLPLIIALYSVPLLALGPLFILWFGIGLLPKIVLVAAVVFFLIFFNSYTGARNVDGDLVAVVALMGGTARDVLRQVIAPSAMVWALAGLRIAIPYSVIAAVAGEMMVAQSGLGALLMKSAGMFDVTGLFAVLTILMALGGSADALANGLERRLLRWRMP